MVCPGLVFFRPGVVLGQCLETVFMFSRFRSFLFWTALTSFFVGTTQPRAAKMDELMFALAEGQKGQFQTLLDDESQSVDLNNQSETDPFRGWTLLALAAAKGDSEVVQLLLKKGARLDQELKLGSLRVTPLMLAAMQNQVSVMREILAHPSFGDAGYEREISIARKLNQPGLVSLLEEAQIAAIVADRTSARLQSNQAPEEDSFQRMAMEAFPGDRMAHTFTDVCSICHSIPGELDAYELLNGLKKLGSIATTQCCRVTFCTSCFDRTRQRCPMCRVANPGSIVSRPTGMTLIWIGAKVSVPVARITGSSSEIPVETGLLATDLNRSASIAQLLMGHSDPEIHALALEIRRRVPDYYMLGGEQGRIHLIKDPDAQVSPFLLSAAAPIGTTTQMNALRSCPAGSALPTRAQLEALSRAMSPGGVYSHHLIPEMRSFWSSETRLLFKNFAYKFNAGSGRVGSKLRTSSDKEVRCVREAPSITPNFPLTPLRLDSRDERAAIVINDLILNHPHFFKWGGQEGLMNVVQDPYRLVPPFVLSDFLPGKHTISDARRVCPTGSRLPTLAELKALARAMSSGGRFDLSLIHNVSDFWSIEMGVGRRPMVFQIESGTVSYESNYALNRVRCVRPVGSW